MYEPPENTAISLALTPHPSNPQAKTSEIEISYEWHANNRLWIRYYAETVLGDLDLPDLAAANRADNLWQTTCFEFFLKNQNDEGYCEFNFSPSNEWAAYQFSSYRDGMTSLALPASPEIGLDVSDTHFALEAEITLPPSLASDALQAGFSAVIAEQGGVKTYWALAHPSGKADFHANACFAHRLKAAEIL